MSNEDLKKELSKFDNLHDMINFLTSKFDLKNLSLGIISKPVIIEGLIKTRSMLNPKVK